MQTQPGILEEICTHGQATYPEECCGFLLGTHTPDGNRVTAIQRVENRQDQNRQRRYVITPQDYREADRIARQDDLDIVGIYHSHPDHPAEPSDTDLAEATFPGYTYVIASIRNGQPADLTAWSLTPDRSRFEAEAIELLESA